ncbi:hypothetical protein [Nodularia spumigena]|jgi:hypothetical protein|uniref:hypothetical protein n=1 Tax=Nodularia spumigena TaxID=70799 RepID=UPI0023307C2E|nr:hypothetical protein [Nodularia spumigena]MDB9500045.1 hypothetical protein [Nodularia spumigena CS-336/02]
MNPSTKKMIALYFKWRSAKAVKRLRLEHEKKTGDCAGKRKSGRHLCNIVNGCGYASCSTCGWSELY